MELLKKIDWNVLQTYIDNSLIIANKHPEYDIWILNYSPRVQSKRVWDDYTLSCRGLIIDADGNILARPFQKFKNYEEYDPSEIDWNKKFEVFEKMDGSLIIVFYYAPRMTWMIASRGSFISEQCLEAQKMFDVNVYDKLDTDLTYLFEIIYPENRIVVDYGSRRELVLLTVIHAVSGHEMSYDTMLDLYSKYFNIVNRLKIATFKDILEYKKSNRANEEGAVVRFEDGFRIKLKFEEYVRLHGIITNVSNIVVWEHLMNNYDFDVLLDRVPDEFYDWLQRTVGSLRQAFNEIERQALKDFVRIYHVNEIGINNKRGDFATEALKTQYHSILFKLYDKRPYDEIIWKMVRPTYSKPFRDGFEYSI